jgi:hypothetical protein
MKYARGLKKVENDLDFIDLVRTVQKLKAGVSALVKNNKDKLDLTKDIYQQNMLIYSESEEEFTKLDNECHRFLSTN